jgi:hypothetical protein
MKPEDRIKHILLDHLIDIGFITKEDIVISELSIPLANRRVDIAVLKKNEAFAFEIKSEKDSIRRLSGQTEDLSKYFNKCIVVFDGKHRNNVLKIINPNIGAWEVDNGSIRKIQRGRKTIVRKSDLSKISKILCYDQAYKKFRKRQENFWKARSKFPREIESELAAIKYGIPKSLRKVSNEEVWQRIIHG